MQPARRHIISQIAALAAAGSARVSAQPARGVPRVAHIFTDAPLASMSGPDPLNPASRAFVHGLRDLGWVDGRNIIIEHRSAEGQPERLPTIMAEVVASLVDMIVTSGTGVRAAMQATSSIPIVFHVEDPEPLGITPNLARPDRNLTGAASTTASFYGKRIQLLHEAAPRSRRVALLDYVYVDPKTTPGTHLRRTAAQAAARTLSQSLIPVGADRPEDFEAAFAAIVRERADALLVAGTNLNDMNAARIVEFATRQRLPAIASGTEHVELGLLMSYGAADFFGPRIAASYVDKILKGARPADLPVQQPTRFELAINLKTAKALGLSLPQSLLLRADRLIE